MRGATSMCPVSKVRYRGFLQAVVLSDDVCEWLDAERAKTRRLKQINSNKERKFLNSLNSFRMLKRPNTVWGFTHLNLFEQLASLDINDTHFPNPARGNEEFLLIS